MTVNPSRIINDNDSVKSIKLEEAPNAIKNKINPFENSPEKTPSQIPRPTSSKGEKIRHLFIEWSLLSSFQCYPKIFQYKNMYAKIIWALFFFGFACLTFLFIVFGLLDYFEFEVVSKIRVYNEDTIVYPTITLCDANLFTTKEAEPLFDDVKIDEQIFFTLLEGNTDVPVNLKFDRTFYKVQQLLTHGMKKSFHLNDNEKQNTGFSMKNVLQSCFFNGKKCNISDFTWFYSYSLGNCFQFNSQRNASQPIKESKLSGFMNGLILFIRNLTNSNTHPTFYGSGLKVFVHNNSYLTSSAEEILVETGKLTSISVKKAFTYRAPVPYSECQDLSDFRSELYDYIKSLNGQYRQKDCFQMCLQNIILNECKCFFSMLPLLNTTYAPCSNLTETNCYMTTFTNANLNINALCSDKCPLECDYVTYDISMSTLNYPNRLFFEELKKDSPVYEHMSLEEFKQSHLAMYLYFPNKEYSEIKEAPKTKFVDLIANLGGALGIFLGFSIFTFVEVFEILFQIGLIFFKENVFFKN